MRFRGSGVKQCEQRWGSGLDRGESESFKVLSMCIDVLHRMNRKLGTGTEAPKRQPVGFAIRLERRCRRSGGGAEGQRQSVCRWWANGLTCCGSMLNAVGLCSVVPGTFTFDGLNP